MMQTGIFSGYFPYDLKKTCKIIRGHDFNTVQLGLHFKDMDLSTGNITKEKCKVIRETFRDHHLPVSATSCYTNILHPDRGEMIWLEHGDSRCYDTRFTVLDGAAAVADAEAKIQDIVMQRDAEFPKPTGKFTAIGGRQ